jgi:hypothetical protein
VAWIAINTYTAEYPGGEQIIDLARLHFRYDLVNVYATVEVDGHNWYLIAPGEWVYHTWVAMAKPVARPDGVSGRWIAVDLYEQTLVAYENDTMVFATLISSGLAGWDTNEGLFNIWARFESDHIERLGRGLGLLLPGERAVHHVLRRRDQPARHLLARRLWLPPQPWLRQPERDRRALAVRLDQSGRVARGGGLRVLLRGVQLGGVISGSAGHDIHP